MISHLTEKEIRAVIKKERGGRVANRYKDKADEMIDSVVNLHEQKQIDEHTFKTIISLVILNTTQDTISNLTSDLGKKNFINPPKVEQNKILFLNYSKKSYA